VIHFLITTEIPSLPLRLAPFPPDAKLIPPNAL